MFGQRNERRTTMRFLIPCCILLLAVGTVGLAEEFYLKHDKTGQRYGPFEFKNGATVKIHKNSFMLLKGTAKQKAKPEWKKIGSFGAITTVYMSPHGLSDKHYIAQVLHTLRSQRSIQQIWFFDDKSKTPTGVPMTDQQMLHWRAKYSINRNTGHEEFVFIKISDSKTSPPGIREEKASIRPGYAE